jgi:uncharacterized damage-inducible protein DinB
MKAMIEDLIRHKWWADAALLTAVRGCESACKDEELRRLLHHILVANRHWLMLTLAKPFDRQVEGVVPDSLDALFARFRETQAEEMLWLAGSGASDLDRTLETPALPGQKIPVAEAMLHVILHSQGHRSQCASRLRLLGGNPPMTDYVLWTKDRPEPAWPQQQS